jgi:CDGSH-type Zn-finger protein
MRPRPRHSLGFADAFLCSRDELAKQGAKEKAVKAAWAKDIIMAEPERPQLNPYQVELEAGKRYAWCRCGRSKRQPFCDGSHTGTGIEPLMFTAERTELALLCGCKDTGDPPFCDGSHLLL